MTSKIDASLFRLKQFIEIENYEGFDPYDALSSPLFRLPLLRSNYTIRFLSQQLVKRSPLDLRTLLKIKKGTNPVTLGLCINGYVNLMRSDNSQISAIDQTCHMLIGKLSEQIPNGYTGACWGYDFPWQSKHFALKAFEPSIVASGIIANGLFEYYKLTKNENVFSYCKSVCDFIINDINHIDKGNNKICFSYTTKDTYCVYNAAMKGVRILSQVYSVTKNTSLLNLATNVVNYVVSNQNKDGSWYYAEGNKGKWIDNYHTGYILDCMKDYKIYSGNTDYDIQYQKGLDYYLNNFITVEGIPKFYHNSVFPVDCTSAAQTILTLCKNNRIELAVKVAHTMIDNMQTDQGSFYFRSTGKKINKNSFMRWSNAWMFYSLSQLSHILKSEKLNIDY